MQTRTHTARRRWLGLMALVLAAALGGVPSMAAETVNVDPKPYLDPAMPLRIPPGPGWPEGWKPPAEPIEAPDSEVENFTALLALEGVPDKPERLEFRVLRPLPEWTNQYPWSWTYETLVCGKTMYVYAYPEPDYGLLFRVSGGDRYTYSTTPTAPVQRACQFVPITQIAVSKAPSPDDNEQIQLERQVILDTFAARGGSPSRGGLNDCRDSTENGTPERIMVCLNDGDASARFDAPAYLDAKAGRVRVPLRFITEMMGGMVSWDPDLSTVTIVFPEVSRPVVRPTSKPGFSKADWWVAGDWIAPNHAAIRWEMQTVNQPAKRLVLAVGRETALVDGREYRIDAPPVIVPPGRMMVPVRFIAQAMGAKVYWVGAQPVFSGGEGSEVNGRYQVHIYTVMHPMYEYPNWVLEYMAQRF